MFSQLVADLLTKALGDYIKALDPGALKVSLWSGDVILQNLELRPDAFDKFNLPFKVKAGYIGLLRLKLNWKNLKSSEAIVKIDRIYAVLQPQSEYTFNHDEYLAQQWEAKKKRLEAIELQQALTSTANITKDIESDPGFVEKLVAAIINNLQVEITRIHLRVEDKSMIGGVVMESLHVNSVNIEGKEIKAAGEPINGQIFKAMEMKGFGIYCDTENLKYVDCSTPASLITDMDIVFDSDVESLFNPKQYILDQGFYSVQLCLNQKRKTTEKVAKLPISVMKIDMGSIKVKLFQRQYQSAMRLLTDVSTFNTYSMYKAFRPSVPIKGHKNVKLWWQYAFYCLSFEVKEKIKSRSLLWTSELVKIRNKYIIIYQKLKDEKKKLTTEETESLIEYEKLLTIDQILYFRKVAVQTISGIKAAKKSKEIAKEKEKQAAGSSSWFGSMFSSKPSNDDDIELSQSALSDIEKQSLYESIEYSPGESEVTLWNAADEKDVLVSVSFTIHETEIILVKQTTSDVNGEGQELLSINVKNLLFDLESYTRNLYLSFFIKDFYVSDLFTKKTQYPQLIRKSRGSGGSIVSSKKSFNDNLLTLKIRSPPLDSIGISSSIFVEGKGLDIFLNTVTFLEAARFFIIPNVEGISIFTQEAIISQISSISSSPSPTATVTKTLRTLIDVYVEAPSIILPINFLDANSEIVLVNLGSLKVDCGLQQKDVNYEEYNISVKNIYILLTTNNMWKGHKDVTEMVTRVLKKGIDHHLIDPVNIEVSYSSCLFPKNLNLASSKLNVNLKPVAAKVTPMKLLNVFVAIYKAYMTYTDYFPSATNDTLLGLERYNINQRRIRYICPTCRKGFVSDDALHSHSMFIHSKSETLPPILSRSNSKNFEADSSLDEVGGEAGSSAILEALAARTSILVSVVLEKITLKISDDGDIEQNGLFELDLADLEVSITQRSYETLIDLTLGDFNIIDHFRRMKIPQSKLWEDKFFLASHSITEMTYDTVSSPSSLKKDALSLTTNSSASKNNLATIRLELYSQLAKDYKLKKAITIVGIEFETLTICVNPETVGALIRWADDVGYKVNAELKKMTKSRNVEKEINVSSASIVPVSKSVAVSPSGSPNKVITSEKVKPLYSIKATIKRFAIVLNTVSNGPFFHLSIDHFYISVLTADDYQFVDGYIGTILASNCSTTNKRYMNILCHSDYSDTEFKHVKDTSGSFMISFDVKLYQSNKMTSSIALILKKARIIALYKTIDELLVYFTSGPIFDAIFANESSISQTTLAAIDVEKQKIIDQANDFAIKTGENIINNVGNVDSLNKISASFPLISIEIIEPMVLIPQSSTCVNYAMAKFDQLTLSNSLDDLASLDIQLKDFSISTNINLSKDLNSTKGRNKSVLVEATGDSPPIFLSPPAFEVDTCEKSTTRQVFLGGVSFILNITVKERIDINIEMPLVYVCCSQTQLGFFLAVTTENFAEKANLSRRETYEREVSEDEETKAMLSTANVDKIATANTFVPINLKLKFIGAIVELVYGQDGYDPKSFSLLFEDSTKVVGSDHYTLAKMKVDDFSLAVVVKAEKQVFIDLLLQKISILDDRGSDCVLPNHKEVVTFAKLNNDAALKVIVELDIDRINVNVEIAGLRFVASNLVFALIDWLTVGLGTDKETTSSIGSDNAIAIAKPNKKKIKSAPTSPAGKSKVGISRKEIPFNIDLTLKLDGLNFYIIASPLDPLSSALVITIGSHIDLRLSKKQILGANIAIDYIRGCRCSSDLKIPEQDMADFCQNFSVTVILNDCDLHEVAFNIFFKSNSFLNLRLSRRDVFILMEGINNLTSAITSKKTSVAPRKSLEGLPMKLSENLSPSSNIEMIAEIEFDESVAPLQYSNTRVPPRGKSLPELLRGHKLSVEIPGIQLTIINDSSEIFTPILIGSMKNLTFWIGTEDEEIVHFSGEFNTSFYYYNPSVSFWEPLLEPFTVQIIGASQTFEPPKSSNLSATVTKKDEGFKFEVFTPKDLNFNVSVAFMNSMITTLNQVLVVNKSKELKFSDNSMSEGFYIKLQNLTGTDIKYSVTARNVTMNNMVGASHRNLMDSKGLGDSSKSLLDSSRNLLELKSTNSSTHDELEWYACDQNTMVNTSIPAHHLYLPDSKSDDVIDEKSILIIQFSTFPIIKVRTTRSGIFPIKIKDPKTGVLSVLIVDISAASGSKIVTLKSGLEVLNELNHTLEVSYSNKGLVEAAILKQNESLFLPVLFNEKSSMTLRPIISNRLQEANKICLFSKSKNIVLKELASVLNLTEKIRYHEMIGFTDTLSSGNELHVLLDVIREGEFSFVAIIRYPIIIENLLPVPIDIGLLEIGAETSSLFNQRQLDAGEAIGIDCLKSQEIIGKLSLIGKVDYAGVGWSKASRQSMLLMDSVNNQQNMSIVMDNGKGQSLQLRIECVRLSEVESSYGYNSEESLYRVARKRKEGKAPKLLELINTNILKDGDKEKEASPKKKNLRNLLQHSKTNHKEDNSFSCALLLRIYAPYWIINHSNFPLSFGSVIGSRPPQDEMMTTVCDSNGRRIPLLLASFEGEEKKILVRSGENNFSNPFSLDAIGTTGRLEVESGENKIVDLVVTIQAAPTRMFRSCVLTLNPRFIVVNRLGYSVQVRQLRTKNDYILKDGDSFPFLEWTKGAGFGKISIRPFVADAVRKKGRNEWLYSQGFCIDQLGEVCIQMIKISTECARYYALPGNPSEISQAIAIVQIRSMNGSVVTFLFPPQKDVKRSTGLLPYRVDNYCSDKVVTIYQSGTRPSMGHIVHPHSSAPFIWVNPQSTKTVDVILRPIDIIRQLNGGDIEMLTPPSSLPLDQTGELAVIETGEDTSAIRFFVVPDGDQKVLVVTDAHSPPSDFSAESLQLYAIRRMAKVKVEYAELGENLRLAEQKLDTLKKAATAKPKLREADRMWIHVLSGRDLSAIGTAESTYVVSIEHNNKRVKTSAAKKAGTPVWNQYLEMAVDPSEANDVMLKFDVVGESFWGDTKFGNSGFKSRFPVDKCYDLWLPVFDGDKGAGEIRVKIQRTQNFTYTTLLDSIKSMNEAIETARQLMDELFKVIAQYESFLEVISGYDESNLPLELALYFSTSVDNAVQEVPLNHLEISLKQVGISLIDSKPRELLYFSLSHITCDLTLCKSGKKALALAIQSFQLDDGSEDSAVPTLVYITPHDEEKNKETNETIVLPPAFQMSILERPHAGHFQFFSALLQEFDVIIPQKWLFRILKMVRDIHIDKISLGKYSNTDDARVIMSFDMFTSGQDLTVLNHDMDISSRLMFDKLELHPVALNITYFQGSSEKSLGSGLLPETGFSGLKAVIDLAGTIITKLNHAPLRFNAFTCENASESQQQLFDRLLQHYLRQALLGSYRLLGNAANDFLGDPVGLVNNLGGGVKDFFYEPAKGLMKSPADFGKGIGKGTSSLVRGTAYGISSTGSTLTTELGHGLSGLSFDKDYQQERRQRTENIKVGSQKANVLTGVVSLGSGVAEGVAGVFVQPFKGAQKEGFGGAIKGVGKGLIGLLVKPVVGASDLIGDTLIGIQNVSKDDKHGGGDSKEFKMKRLREPRYFQDDGRILVVYSPLPKVEKKLEDNVQKKTKRMKN